MTEPLATGPSKTTTDQSLWRDPGIDFVLVEPSHCGNIGSAARAIRVMGFGQLVIVNPRQMNFREKQEAIALASGATDVLRDAITVETLDVALARSSLGIAISAAGREFSAPPISPRAACALAKVELSLNIQVPSDVNELQRIAPRVSFVFGTERTGLSIDQAQRCQHLCSIESNPAYGSLNLSQAIQVMAYTMRQSLHEISHVDAAPANAFSPTADALEGFRGYASLGQIEGFMQHLEQTMIAIGYLDPEHPKRLMPRLRRMFARARLEQEEIDILRGILRKAASLVKPDGH